MSVERDFFRPMEHWRDVAGYGGDYRVSDRGRVVSMKSGYAVELSLVGGGRYVNLCRRGVMSKLSVSYLVARAFIPNMEMRPYVRHKDGDARNHAAENLEWSERKDSVSGRVEGNRAHRVMRYRLDGSEVMGYGSIMDAIMDTGVRRDAILRCIRGLQKTAGGYKWKEL